jgi:hypothetical protein
LGFSEEKKQYQKQNRPKNKKVLYFLHCFLQRSVSIQLVFEIPLIYYIYISK